MDIRLETPADYRTVEELTRHAFWDVYQPGCTEHLVLHQLRKSPAFIKDLSYVVVENQQIIGHIAYSKMIFEGSLSNEVICFGPLSVHPDYQNKGIGKQLITYTLEKAQELAYRAVLITGSPDYYHHFGFKPAKSFGLFLEGLPVEDDAPFFMAKELLSDYFSSHSGSYSFTSEFSVSPEALALFDQSFPKRSKRAPKETDM